MALAPGLFSTITGLAQSFCNPSASGRASTSTGPPGGYDTTILTGFEGYCCANELPTSTAVIRPASRVVARFIGSPERLQRCGSVRERGKGSTDRGGRPHPTL